MPTRFHSELGLYDARGHRKYLTPQERTAFLVMAEETPREVRTLCGVLAYTGCRLSEALLLTADRVDLRANLVVFESLMKRRSGIYRAVPVPHAFVDMLDLVHGVRELQSRPDQGRGHPPPVTLESHDRLATRSRGHGPGRHTWPPCQSKGIAPWVRRGRRHVWRTTQSCAEVVGSCAAFDDGDICGCCR
jgi:integrase